MSVKMKRVCIIGAGPAGLATAKILLHSQTFAVTIYEKADRLGGIWSINEDSTTEGFLHRDIPTNLSRFTVSFSDLDWQSVDLHPRNVSNDSQSSDEHHTPMFPKAYQVHRYLETYAERHGLEINLGHEVFHTQRHVSDSGAFWEVTVRNQHGQQDERKFDHLVLASGFFSQPRPLSEVVAHSPINSKSNIMHSSRFRSLRELLPPERAAGKSIVVIGGGNSAGEAAAAIAQQLSNVWYSPDQKFKKQYENCKIIHVTPRPIYALPPYVPANESNTTFLPIDLKLYDLSRRPRSPIVANAGILNQAVKDTIHASLQKSIGGDQSDLGAPGLQVPTKEPRSAAQVALTEHYPEFVRSGVIEVQAGRVKMIDEAKDGTYTLSIEHNSARSQLTNVGAIVYATGYTPNPALTFLPQDVQDALNYDPTSPRLPLLLDGWQTMSASIPDLAFTGFYEGPYWGVIEMQARFTAQRWLNSTPNIPDINVYEEKSKLLDLRRNMQERNRNVPQYWFGDYTGYCEDPKLQEYIRIQRNDLTFGGRTGPVCPARYLTSDAIKSQAESIMQNLQETWDACLTQGRYVPRAAFRALHGNWLINRVIKSALADFPSGTLEGHASFHPRSPTLDKSGQKFDFEYLYIESGNLVLSNGFSVPARRRYVYRYSEERDELSVWFIKPDNDLEVEYLFHNLAFVSPDEAVAQGACVARADHLCVEDMYWTEYRLPLKGIALHEFETRHTVKGPGKDYVTTTKYSRPSVKFNSRHRDMSTADRG